MRVLHSAVRDWIERSAVAQKNEHLLANLPYVDLMFAFGFATLGDHVTADKLVEDARKVLEGPIPPRLNPKKDADPVTVGLVRSFLFKALKYRIEQALEQKPHVGPLSAGVLADLDEIRRVGQQPPINNSHKLAEYVIGRSREQVRMLEPTERVDVYADWTKHGDAMKKGLAELHTIRDPAVLAERIRKLYRDGVPGREPKEVQFYTLYEGLPLAVRVSEAFTMELLEHVPAALLAGTGGTNESPDLPRKQGELLERALYLAGHFNREDIVKKLVDDFTALVRSKPESTRYRLINVAARQCIRNLKRLGLANEIDRFLTLLHGEVMGDVPVTELRKKYADKPEAWATVFQTLLNLASGWMYLGLADRVAPILSEARNELLANALGLQPKDYTELARAYVALLGDGPPESGLLAMIELFRKMDPRKISNTWTTAQYYSRFHLNLVEDVVLVLRRPWLEEPVPLTVTA
jgi:hypothetical protein